MTGWLGRIQHLQIAAQISDLIMLEGMTPPAGPAFAGKTQDSYMITFSDVKVSQPLQSDHSWDTKLTRTGQDEP